MHTKGGPIKRSRLVTTRGTVSVPVQVMVLSVLYSLAGLGIAIVNDFKSIEGDRAMGLVSLPVQFGVNKACTPHAQYPCPCL